MGLRRRLGRSALAHGGRRTAEAAVAFAAASYAGIPGLLASVLGVTADITAQVLKDRRELEASKRANKFLFLYEMEDRLAPA